MLLSTCRLSDFIPGPQPLCEGFTAELLQGLVSVGTPTQVGTVVLKLIRRDPRMVHILCVLRIGLEQKCGLSGLRTVLFAVVDMLTALQAVVGHLW